MPDQPYNHELCTFSHRQIDKEILGMKANQSKMDDRIGKASNRWFILMTGVCITLVGVLVNLIILLARVPKVPKP